MNLTLYKSVYGKLASLNSVRYAITRKHYFLGLPTGLLAIFFFFKGHFAKLRSLWLATQYSLQVRGGSPLRYPPFFCLFIISIIIFIEIGGKTHPTRVLYVILINNNW